MGTPLPVQLRPGHRSLLLGEKQIHLPWPGVPSLCHPVLDFRQVSVQRSGGHWQNPSYKEMSISVFQRLIYKQGMEGGVGTHVE